ncbi:hypothetical protein CASFOL_022634 [Castilleja foliolosa]|uniref:Uncharacterized protein n=1 Tax=Castilleja foliolosa TaxID=1961234 RepID=A0ABD3CZ71_9LAMI
MVRLSTISVTIILVTIFIAQALEARKVPSMGNNKGYFSLGGSWENVLPSPLVNGSQVKIVSKKLDKYWERRNIVQVDRRDLGSVPSPGAGH